MNPVNRSASDFEAAWFDGETARRYDTHVTIAGGYVHLSAAERSADYRLDALRLSSPVAGVPLRVALPDGGTLVVAALDEHTAASLGRPQRSLAYRLESNLAMVFAALLGVVVAAVFGYRDGVPWLATKVATRVPYAAEASLGETILAGADKLFLGRSRLSEATRGAIDERFARLATHAGAAQDLRLLYRRSRSVFPGANAFALPGGTIVVTDGLVEAIADPDRVAAVLAHEIGHEVRRHSLVQLLQSSATALLFGAVLGDVSGVGSIAAAAPGFLLRLSFSRDAESDADRFAYDLLRASDLSPALLGDALEALLETECDGDGDEAEPRCMRRKPRGGDMPGYLSTHPAIRERIDQARAAAR